ATLITELRLCAGCYCSAPRRAAFPAGRGGAQSGALCRPQRTVCPSLSRHDMGVEKEKLDTSIIMDEDEFNLSIEPILTKKGKVYSEAPDRDPNEINTHLKVKSALARALKVKTCEAQRSYTLSLILLLLCVRFVVMVIIVRMVGFEDVIGEPSSTHSFDRVWIGSHATFELVKFFFYRLLTTLLAVPMAFTLGLLFGLLSCVHV
ncbi:hypothetical protein CCH79_00017671, partial [Gambusia affinis]